MMGFAGTLTIVFIVLKMLEIINWSWLVVLSPLWISILIVIAIVIIGAIITTIKER